MVITLHIVLMPTHKGCISAQTLLMLSTHHCNTCTMSNNSILARVIAEAAINHVVADLIKQKEGLKRVPKKDKNKNKSPYEAAIASLQENRVVISVAAHQKRVSRALKKLNKSNVVEINVAVSISSDVSSITQPPTSSTPTVIDIGPFINSATSAHSNGAGHPKGSSNVKKRDDAAKLAKCKDVMAVLYDSKHKNRKAEGFQRVEQTS